MKHAALQVMNLPSFYAAFASPVPLATTTTTKPSPLHPAPSSSPGGAPSPPFLSGLLTPLSVGGKYVTDATQTSTQITSELVVPGGLVE
jgi:hypothetical protein